MEAEFDPHDKASWYFGPLNREETNNILMKARENGTFLVRDSQSIKGDFVLCVKEDSKVSHYIINKIHTLGDYQYRIGDQQFPDMPNLLQFYKSHYLDTTALVKVAPKTTEKVIAKYDFPGRDPEDLPFKKGEILEVVIKDEEKWWTCRNKAGREGQVPVPYVQKYDEPKESKPSPIPFPPSIPPIQTVQLPAPALVTQERIATPYDKRMLTLKVGTIITVTKMNVNGQWEGEINGTSGMFPFTHVRFLTSEECEKLKQNAS
ncbi:hypothetical protein ACJMK2_019631 [Sinanodonta woodiana]|uniref:Adapter molecule Crk n=1 Tax=Sinanodonta woodiana TaxID=1069815 RepID=A0ABD3TYP3_SINWO